MISPIKKLGFFILLLLGTFNFVRAQGFLSTSEKDIVDESGDPFILKGMGLGGWMLQEGYMLETAGFANAQHQLMAKIEELIGTADMELFYDTWLQNHVQKSDIDALKAWGFNSVRLPMHYNLFTLPIEEEPVEGVNTWLDKGFILTDSLISWCAQNEMYVVLDMHAAPGGQGYDQGISDYDPSKPSIWESIPNRRKCASLWKQIAARYADEPWVAGYDLINEPNWDLGGSNAGLKIVYDMITDSIRAVDQKHILFIEGNWFANDFNGLTPPWDDKFVYSPHKYWSYNDQASIQWVLDLRDTYNVPLYFGETGENSNTWFHDAIALFDEHNIGWAWWPMKKVESISGPLTVKKPADYQTLLDYWNDGGTAPTAAFAKSALLQLAEAFKYENCHFQKDVIDAMFRQQTTDETLPFALLEIPGVIHATDFDLGKNGQAYSDGDVANYNVSTGNFTAWNAGWVYRNDGVDIESISDDVNSNGYAVGWIGSGEWMQYEVNVENTALYDIELRVASGANGGSFHFNMEGSKITPNVSVSSTGGWYNWQTILVENVILNSTDKKMRFFADNAGFNLSGFEFIEKGPTSAIDANYLNAQTTSNQSIQLELNKSMAGPLPALPAGFTIFINSVSVPITAISIDAQNPRILNFDIDDTIVASDEVRISYNSAEVVMAADGTSLLSFTNQPVQNNVIFVHGIPGRIQAEDFFDQSGIQLENTSDIGGGQNIGFLDVGDYIDYYINVSQPGLYKVDYRTAAESASGAVELQLINAQGNVQTLHSVTFSPTGGWQTWNTTSSNVHFYQTGMQHLRLRITQPLFNVNWMDFDFLTPTTEDISPLAIQVFPNPGHGLFTIHGRGLTIERLEVMNCFGQTVLSKPVVASQANRGLIHETLDLSDQPNGYYFVRMLGQDSEVYTERVLKVE